MTILTLTVLDDIVVLLFYEPLNVKEFRHFSKTVIFRVNDVASFTDLFHTMRPKIQLPGNSSAGRGDHRWSGGGDWRSTTFPHITLA